MNTTTKEIKISEEQLEDVLEKELKQAEGAGLQGMRIPIFVKDDGTIISGDWMSNNSYQPDMCEIYRVEPWDRDLVVDEEDRGEYDEDVQNLIDNNMLPFAINDIKERLKEDNMLADDPAFPTDKKFYIE